MTAVERALEAGLTEVADGVHAFIQPPGGWCVSNAGVVVGDDTVVVVDTLATQRRAERLRLAVDALGTAARRIVVNTHHHGDHVFGNHLFGPATTIVGHELIVREMVETGLALTGLWPEVDWGDVRVTPPTVTFDDRISLTVGGRRAELIHVGPAHTNNDVVVWLPDCRVLFAGDVVLSGCSPFVLMGSVTGSLAAIERLTALAPQTVVCGHGPVAGPGVLAQNAAYLKWVRDLAGAGRHTGLTPLETALEARIPDRFAHLLDPERLVGNLHRAYAEQTEAVLGAPIDVPPVFSEMISYNGGKRPACLA